MSKKHKYPIPPGFEWNHARDTYVHPDGRTWNDQTNVQYDQTGMPLKTSIDLPISPKDLIPVDPPVTVEQMIQSKGLTAPRVTPADIDAVIKSEEFQVFGVLTVCRLTLQNGFIVVGESACASPENFNAEVGQRVSRDDAKRKIWPLLGYELRSRLAAGQMIDAGTNFQQGQRS